MSYDDDLDSVEPQDPYDADWQEFLDTGDGYETFLGLEQDFDLDEAFDGSEWTDIAVDDARFDFDDERGHDLLDEELQPPRDRLARLAVAEPADDRPRLRLGDPPRHRRRAPADPELWHLTHGVNLPGIVRSGGLLPGSIAAAAIRPGMAKLVGRREDILTPLGAAVGECVPFYFTPHTPYAWRVLDPKWAAERTTATGTERIQTDPTHYVYLRSTFRSVSSRSDRWLFTNGNATSSGTRCWRERAHLPSVEWEAVHAPYSRANHRQRQAEFLTADPVPLGLITHAICASAPVAASVEQILEGQGVTVDVDSELFRLAHL